MSLILFNNLTEKDKSGALEKLICHSTPNRDFFLMTMLAILMATFGLLLNNVAVVIGSMLIAPILYPILSLSLGIVIADGKLISRSVYTLVKAVTFGIAAAAVISVFFGSLSSEQSYGLIMAMEPSLVYAIVAMIASLAASFALVKPQLSETLPGVAISISLIPPLGAVGVGLASLDWLMIRNAFLLFIVNIAGMVFASMIVFSLMNLYLKRKVILKAVKKEDGKMEKEKNI